MTILFSDSAYSQNQRLIVPLVTTMCLPHLLFQHPLYTLPQEAVSHLHAHLGTPGEGVFEVSV